MNLSLQKINAKYKKKVEDFDYVTKKCEEIHKANQRLIQLLGSMDSIRPGYFGIPGLSGDQIMNNESQTGTNQER